MAGAQAADLAKIDPEFEAMLKYIPVTPRLDIDIATMRRLLSEAKQAMTAAQSGNQIPDGVKEEDMKVPAGDDYQIPVRVYKPESAPSGGSPLIIFLHGGGFCLGGLENEELNCRLFVQNFGAVCVNVDYRLAPEHPFPSGIRDSWDAVKWAAAHAHELGADPSKGFVVGGTSAGGNHSAAISLLARDSKLNPPLTGLALLVPAVMDHRAIPEEYKAEVISYKQNADAPILGVAAVDNFMSNYKPDLKSSEYNIFAPGTKHNNLPPTFLQICGMDPLRDEAMVFERVLREHGTKTRMELYPGVPHGFWSFFPDLALSKKFIQDTVEGVRWLLHQV